MHERDAARTDGRWLFAAAIAAFVGCVAAAVVMLLTGADLADAGDDLLALGLAASALLALLGWRHDQAGASAEHAAARAKLRQAQDMLDEERRRARTQHLELNRERDLRGRIDRARRAEREWARELRDQLRRLHQGGGTLARGDDVPSLLLHLSRRLVDADKALLLARGDEDHDGRLDLRAHEGFEQDPSESAIAQRFAREVLERDRIVREDEPETASADAGAPADEEIQNLAAIPIFIQDEFSGVVVCANRDGGFEDLDDHVLLSLGDHAAAVLENSRLQGALRKSYLATVQMFADAIESKDPSASAEHEELSSCVYAVASRLDLPPSGREELLFAWLLHDVGKLGISERLLLKPGRLTPEERRKMELHCGIGARLVKRVPALAPVAPAVLHHHERFDGTGYPSGLSGEHIPLKARIIAVADAFAAMTSERPYREPVPTAQALAELDRCAGTQFDPRVVSAFTAEVSRRPPSRRRGRVRDPQIEARRDEDEPVLGQGPVRLTDNLTLLYSHRYFHEAVETEAGRAAVARAPFSVVVVELANLPLINDRDGFAAGDHALVVAARELERIATREGGTACRYSGRRLGIVLPGRNVDATASVVAYIAVALRREGVQIRTGVATWQPGDAGRDVIARAHEATRLTI